MKKFLFGFLMTAVLVSTVLTSCDENDDPGTGPAGTDVFEGRELKGEISKAVSLDASVIYNLTAPLIINAGGELTIPAGTTIKAEQGFDSYILVAQGGKIFVNGTAAQPVTMTSSAATPAAEDWGGLIINGYAKLAGGEKNVSAEINTDYKFGGDNDGDNSGRITYLTIAYTGARNSAEVEHNGLTLNGVGNGTVIENIYIPHGADDGIEFFGGSVNVKNLLVVDSDDDCFDATQGWSGTLTNCYGVWTEGFTSTEKDPTGVEIDGNFDGLTPDQQGQTDCKIENMTVDLNGKDMTNILKIRRGAKVNVVNALVKGNGTIKEGGFIVDMTDSKGNGLATSTISITNKLFNKPAVDVKNASDYPSVVVGGNNTGCDVSLFAWTGFRFPDGSNINVYAGNDLKGDISNVVTLNPSVEYKLTAPVIVKAGGELTIPAGTVIKANQGFDKYILVAQGGKIFVNGTASQPVTMTSAAANPAAEDWGGLIINGYAKLAGGEKNVSAEINTDYKFGGDNDEDNSGKITYLTLAYTGARNSAEVEHNGLTLNGVGNKTVIENIFIPHGADDGIEFFGGSVNVTNLYVLDSDDDCFDATQGWSGTLTNAWGVWSPGFASTEKDPTGIEIDGNFDGLTPDQTGQTNCKLNKITIELGGKDMTNVMKIRRGATVNITNALVKGNGTIKSGGVIVDMSDSKGLGNAASLISVTNSLTNKPAENFKFDYIDTDPAKSIIFTGDKSNIKVEAGNTGSDTSVFAWTSNFN